MAGVPKTGFPPKALLPNTELPPNVEPEPRPAPNTELLLATGAAPNVWEDLAAPNRLAAGDLSVAVLLDPGPAVGVLNGVKAVNALSCLLGVGEAAAGLMGEAADFAGEVTGFVGEAADFVGLLVSSVGPPMVCSGGVSPRFAASKQALNSWAISAFLNL